MKKKRVKHFYRRDSASLLPPGSPGGPKRKAALLGRRFLLPINRAQPRKVVYAAMVTTQCCCAVCPGSVV